MDNHDSAYRLLFSHADMVRDLLLGFVPAEWVAELDMSTLENSRSSADIQRVVANLVDWLRSPGQRQLRRHLTEWLRRIHLPRRLPDVQLPEMQDLQEVQSMLAERVQKWYEDAERRGLEAGMQKGMQQGMQQGIQQGMQQGMQQGEAALLLRLLSGRFGPLPESLVERVKQASLAELEQWAERLLQAPSLHAVFD